MKKYFFLSVALIFGLGILSAQVISCDNFKAKHFSPDTLNNSTMQLGIQFQANSNQMVGYPHVSLITDCNGDSVAVGQMYYFGQLGNTTQDYPVKLLKAKYCEPLTVTFIYLNESTVDTCYFIIGYPASNEIHKSNKLEIFPNPSSGKITVKFNNHVSKHELAIFDFLGQRVFSWIESEDIAIINFHHLPSGQYFLKADGMSQVLVIE